MKFKQVICSHSRNIQKDWYVDPIYSDIRYDKCLDCEWTGYITTKPRPIAELEEFKTVVLIALVVGAIVGAITLL